MYKFLKNEHTQENYAVILFLNDARDSMIVVPFEQSNTDYQNYLQWVSEGNTTEPADVPPSE